MRRPNQSLFAIAMVTMLYAAMSHAEEPSASPIPVAKDLTAVIALQGLPCGKVVNVQQRGENDYIASCEDGHRYRVYVNADGRVIAEKQ